ncbi:MAG: N-acetylmuramoyl-L-alanine amidase, partial [Clostridium sp.]
ISSGGKRVYMATKDQSTGERFALCTDIPGGSGGSGGSEVRVKEYSETGICYPNMTLNIRSMPCATTGEILDQYYDGESVIYDYVVITDKYVWISWTSGGSGRRVYMAVKDQSTGERFALCTDIPGSGSGGAAGGSSMPGVRKVFIDPGHGGNDPGAIGNGLKENEVVLNIANKLGTLLTNSGISVKYSRRNNNYVELSERARQANEWGADLFVSIHANAFNGSAYGTECYTHPTDSLATKQLSANVANIISSKLGLYNRGHKEADFAVLRLTSMPAILVETAFIDNSRDANLLKQKESEFASAIYTAITGLSIGNENQSVDPSDLFKGELFQQLLRDSWMFNGIGLEFTPDELTAKSNTVITSHFPLVSVHGELSLSAQVFDGETISFGHDFNSSSLAQSYVGKYIATDLSINFAEKELTKLFDEIGVSIPFGTHITVKTQLVNLTTIKIIMESKVDTSNLPELYQRINMYSRIVISITNNSPLGRLYIPIGAYEKHEVDDGVGLNWEAIRGIALVAVGTAITIGCVALAIGSAGSSVPATVIGLLAISGTKYNPEN